jgi:branched-chain amino acid transport system permease protein
VAEQGSSPVVAAPRSDEQLGIIDRIPIRSIVLTALTIGLGAFLVAALWRTLTLPAADRIPLSVWKDLLVAGVSLGAIYGLIALGYSLVYGILRMINFAHGEIFMAGGMISFFLGRAMAANGFMAANPWLSLIILFVVGAAASTALALGLERIAYRPLRNAPRLVPLITAIGASLLIQNSFQGFFGSQNRGYPLPSTLEGKVDVLGFNIGKVQLLTIAIGIVSVIVLSLFVSRSRTGRSMRAVAEDREIAELMGIDVDRTIVVTFIIGGVFAGIAGVLWGLTFQSVRPTMGFIPGITAFTAAVLGGIGSVGGAALGGLLIGVLSSTAPFLLLNGFHVPSAFQLKDVITFLILVVVLIFKPTGLLGGSDKEKV